MIHEICKNETFLARQAELATPDAPPIAADLPETLARRAEQFQIVMIPAIIYGELEEIATFFGQTLSWQ